jgi:predicted MPP superfamily phosphohydrolase
MPRKPRKKIRDIAKSVLPEKNAPHVAGGVSVFVASALALQIILLLLHFMIYETIAAAFGIGGFVLALIFGLLSLTFISASLLSAVAGNAAVRTYYRFSAVWFAFVAPLCGACAGFVVVENLLPRWGLIFTPFVAGVICFGAAIAASFYGIWNSGHIRVTRTTVSLPNVPAAWRGKRIAFFADTHLGNVRGSGFVKKIVKKVRTLDASAVAIGGDMFDGVKCNAEKLIAPFRDLHLAHGIYFVSGNHEYIRDTDVFLGAIRNVGIRILRNEKVTIDGMDLVGVDWCDTDKHDAFAAVLKNIGITKERPSILLRHVPDNLGVPEHAGISLQLSGHTHQGQFWPLSLVTHYFYQGFDYGFHYFKKMAVYTTSGIGTWMSPFRFGTKAEIVLIEFK